MPESFLNVSKEEQDMILLHELEHFKQFHFLILLLHNCICFIYWFNPFVYFSKRMIKEQMELCVDECILKNKSNKERKIYGNYLLKYALTQSSHSLSFSSEKSMLKKRIKNIVEEKSMKKTMKLFVVICVCILTACSSIEVKKEVKEVEQKEVVDKKSDFKGAVLYLQSIHDEYESILDTEDVNEESQCFHPRGVYYGENGDKIEILSLPHPPYYYKVQITQDEKQRTLYLPFDGKGVDEDFMMKVNEKLKTYHLKQE